jgi:hypothetical protein
MAPVRTGAIYLSGITTGKTMTDEKPAAKDKSSSSDSAKTDSSSSSAPANYSRGEGQKPVSAAYRENWNLIFGKETAKRKPAKASAKTKSAKGTTVRTKKKKR